MLSWRRAMLGVNRVMLAEGTISVGGDGCICRKGGRGAY